MKMFTGEVLDKVELRGDDKAELKKFFDEAMGELQKNAHEHILLSEKSKLLYAKSGLGFTQTWLSSKRSFYWTDAHLLMKDGQVAAACLMTDFYEDFLTGSPYRFNLSEWINSIDVNDNKKKIYCFDGNIGIGFDNVIIDNNGEVELCLHPVYTKEQKQPTPVVQEPKISNTDKSHVEMLRITRNLMSHKIIEDMKVKNVL